jgi:hypothetical protein
MKIFLLIFLLYGCATQVPPQPTESQKELPEWVYRPEAACQNEVQICTVAEGPNLAVAQLQANDNLLNIFQASFPENIYPFPWAAEVKEEINKVNESMIQSWRDGISVIEKFQKDNLFYVMVSLEKSLIKNQLSKELEYNNRQWNISWDRRKRGNARRLSKLAFRDELLRQQLGLINGAASDTGGKLEMVAKWYKNLPPERISLRAGRAPDWLLHKIKSILKDSGYEVTGQEAQNVLLVQIDSIKEFIGEEMEKYTLTLILSGTTSGTESQIRTSETISARNQQEALIKIRPYFEHYLERHLRELL